MQSLALHFDLPGAYCRGFNDYKYCGSTFLIWLQYRILPIDLKIILVPIEAANSFFVVR